MEQACTAYSILVETLLENLKSLPKVELRVTPNDGIDAIRKWLKPGWVPGRQGNGDLTDRLIAAFAEAFSNGAKKVVIIGSDCPDVTAADIEAAWKSLDAHDLVLGPASDGGYWLVGLCRPLPEIFTNIPWSTEGVLEKTLAVARTLGVKTQLLRTLNDVDTFADWERFQRSRGLNVEGGLFDSGAAEPR